MSTIQIVLVRVVPLMLLMNLAGCANDIQTAHNALPQTIPASVDDWNHGLNHVDFIQNFQLSDYAKIVMLAADTASVHLPPKDDNTYQPVTETLAKTSSIFSDALSEKLKGVIHVEATGKSETGKSLTIQLRVIDMDPGSQAMRYWVGLGAGKAHTQIEGDIVDSSTGKTLASFKDDDYGSGGFFGGGYGDLLSNEVQTIGHNVGSLLEAFAPASRAASAYR